MIQVELPDGNIGEFPDEMSHQEIEGIIQKQFPPQNKSNIKENYIDESLLNKSGRFAQKYINEPVEELGREALNIGAGAGQGLANTGVGVRNLLAKGANLLPGVNIPMEKSLNIVPNNINTSFGDLLGMLAGSGVVSRGASAIASHISDIPNLANALKRASDIIGKSPIAIQKSLGSLKSASKNALSGAAISPEDQGLGAALGAGGSLLGSAIGKSTGKIGEKLGFSGKPGRETIEGLNYSEVAPSVEAAERLGTYLRPSEASRNPFIAGLEGKYPRTREAAKENIEFGMKREESEKSAINKLLSTIYDKSLESNNKVKEMYKKAYGWNMKTDLVNQLKSDPIIADAFENVLKDKAWQRKLGDLPENNYAYLDKVRKSISDQETKLMKSGEKSKALEYTDARKTLVKIMDEAVPDYAKARSEAQKSIIRSQIEKRIGKKEINGKNFFNEIIRNDNKYNELHESLKNVPEAQAMLKDMKDAWHSLINVEKPSTSSYQSEKAINQARGSLQKVLEAWNQITGNKKNLESVKFIRSDQWIKELKNAHKSRDKNRLESTLSDIMGKIFPGGFNTIEKGNKE